MTMMAAERVPTLSVLFVAALTTIAAAQDTTKQGPDQLAKANTSEGGSPQGEPTTY
jgi:hypothetical protein